MRRDMAVNQSRTDLVYNWSNNNSFKWIEQECLLCGGINKSNSGICSSCVSDLPKIKTTCPVCARPTNTPLPCAGCINNKTKHLNFVCALYRYQYPINFLIQAMKFHNKIIIAKSFGRLLAEKIYAEGRPLPECIIPVPLHRSRIRQRGYNQSLEIVRAAAKDLTIPIAINACNRNRPTRPQTSLKIDQRKKNVIKAFDIVKNFNCDHVAIVDDVMTTGHTVNELVNALSRAGIARIDIWVCARTL